MEQKSKVCTNNYHQSIKMDLKIYFLGLVSFWEFQEMESVENLQKVRLVKLCSPGSFLSNAKWQ